MVLRVLQVLEVVRSNYDTLTLKLQESLDQYPRYEEKPKETAFFTQLVSVVLYFYVDLAGEVSMML